MATQHFDKFFILKELILLSGSPRHYVPRDDNGDYFAHSEHRVRVILKKEECVMPYKVGKKTKTKGYPILKHENGKWKVIAHSSTREKAEASIRARHMGAHMKG